MPAMLILPAGDDSIKLSDDNNYLITEIRELGSELTLIRKQLGAKKRDDHSDIYGRFLTTEKRKKEITHLLMLHGHIP